MLQGVNFIGFKRSSKGSKKFKTVNPKTLVQNPQEFSEANHEEILEACDLARRAFKEYRNTSIEKRIIFIDEICKNLNAARKDLVEQFCSETGFSSERANLELDRTIFQLKNYVGKTESLLLSIENVDLVDDKKLTKSLIPIGPVVVFGASNFPFAYSTVGGDTASALAAGCPVIVKSHPWHAGTGEMVASLVIDAAQKTGMPNGVFSNLNSSGIEVGQELVLNGHVKAVGFTGSIKGGRAIMDLANSRSEPIPVYAEMGSTNPIFVSNQVLSLNSKHWAQLIAESMVQGNGQFCTSPGMIIARKSEEFNLFKETIASELSQKANQVMLHPQIAANFSEGFKSMTYKKDSEVIKQGESNDKLLASAGLISVSAKQFVNDFDFHQEVFGPFAIFIEWTEVVELNQIIDALHGQLTATILFEPEEEISDLIEHVKYKAGRLVLNGVPTGVSVSKSMHHGGPYPASSDARFTAVGEDAVLRWLRPVTVQEQKS